MLGAGFALQRQYGRRIARDPEQAVLASPPEGRPIEIRSADGTLLHAEAFGPETAPTLVLAHGWTENLTYWTYQIRELTGRGLRIVAYDLRGTASSDPAAGGDYSIARFGEDLEAVLATARPGGPARDGRRPLARRDVDRRLGRAPRRRAPGRAPRR